jgi:hypothetical protein
MRSDEIRNKLRELLSDMEMIKNQAGTEGSENFVAVFEKLRSLADIECQNLLAALNEGN